MEENKKEVKKEHKSNKALVEELNNKIKDLEEEVLRSKADLINYRKRKDEETANMIKFSNSELITSLLPILDNFERAINLDDNNLDDTLSSFLSGFKLIYVNLKSLLEANGVKEIDCLGKTFDPNFETSVFMDNDPNYEDEVVLEVLQKGYTYNDKLLRSASVKINKKDLENKEGNDKNE